MFPFALFCKSRYNLGSFAGWDGKVESSKNPVEYRASCHKIVETLFVYNFAINIKVHTEVCSDMAVGFINAAHKNSLFAMMDYVFEHVQCKRGSTAHFLHHH